MQHLIFACMLVTNQIDIIIFRLVCKFDARLSDQIFRPVIASDAELTTTDGRTVAQVMQAWGKIGTHHDLLAHMVPFPVAPLLARGGFGHTLMLGRSAKKWRLFEGIDFPPSNWLASAEPVHIKVSVFVVFYEKKNDKHRRSMCSFVVATLPRWLISSARGRLASKTKWA